MILCIGNILTPEELELMVSKVKTADFIDGQVTAGWHARWVKHNTQLPASSLVLATVHEVISVALARYGLFQIAVHPHIIRPITLSRCQVGMNYSSHIDDVLMRNPTMRSDVSMTLFLNDSVTDDKGELVIEDIQGEAVFKLPAGSAIVYPSSTLHRVEEVTRGERLTAVTWIQSLVRDAGQQESLFDLNTARQTLFDSSGKTSVFDVISKSHANLFRQWMEI
jgi:PKHD-type hydroxylase